MNYLPGPKLMGILSDGKVQLPRFYFDVREGTSFASDDEGQELESLDFAERMAAESAAEIGRDRPGSPTEG
jgi:hypothetical protein